MNRFSTNPTRPYAPAARAGLLALALLLAATGCKKPLLTPTEERSQYDRYDAIRGQRTSAYNYDEFGTRKPNLRGRLLPKE